MQPGVENDEDDEIIWYELKNELLNSKASKLVSFEFKFELSDSCLVSINFILTSHSHILYWKIEENWQFLRSDNFKKFKNSETTKTGITFFLLGFEKKEKVLPNASKKVHLWKISFFKKHIFFLFKSVMLGLIYMES
jgi:hypothetical protein